jgi:hypothetical protein
MVQPGLMRLNSAAQSLLGGLQCAVELKGAPGPGNVAALDGMAGFDILNGAIVLDSTTAHSGRAKLSSMSGLGSMTVGVVGVGAATSNNTTLPNDTTILNAAGLNVLAGMAMLGSATAAGQTAGLGSMAGFDSTVAPNSAMVPNGTMVPNSATVTACNVARLEVVNSMTMLDDTVGRLGGVCAAALDILHDAEVFGGATVHSSVKVLSGACTFDNLNNATIFTGMMVMARSKGDSELGTLGLSYRTIVSSPKLSSLLFFTVRSLRDSAGLSISKSTDRSYCTCASGAFELACCLTSQ